MIIKEIKEKIDVSKLLSTYLQRHQELKNYETVELTDTVVSIFKDYIVSYFNKENDIITLKGAVKGNALFNLQTEINKNFKELGLVEEIKSHLFEMIYYGQYCIKIDYDRKNKKFFKVNLLNPCNVFTVLMGGGKTYYHLATPLSAGQKIPHYSLIRFGKPNLYLIVDMDEENTIVKNNELVTCYSLYYYLTGAIRNYLLKDTEQGYWKRNILMSLAVPMALFDGNLNKVKAIESSDRLYCRIYSYLNQISNGLIQAAAMFYFLLTKKEIMTEEIECNLFGNWTH